MMIIDAQVHAYERDRPGRPWAAVLHGPSEVTGDNMVQAMDDVGVDGALLISPYTMYRHDASYALEVYAKNPGRFGLIKPFDPNDPAVSAQVDEWASHKGTVGVRIMMRQGVSTDAADPGINAVAAAARKHDIPLNLLCYNRLPQVYALAARNPDTQFVIDHVGLTQPFKPPPLAEPWADLENVLKAAEMPNIAIKITGACTLSCDVFPYKDIWDPLVRIYDAFGLERCLWGTDWTRATGILTYKQGVDTFLGTGRLSDSEKAMLMGGALTRIYKWMPTKG
ncbi:MAG: hypothetical protein EXR05_06155 [Acetobacteraceae bacterium]|nr:hypothetical protein [Acetobacteraceae bacterium]